MIQIFSSSYLLVQIHRFIFNNNKIKKAVCSMNLSRFHRVLLRNLLLAQYTDDVF